MSNVISKQSLNIIRFKYMNTVYKISEQTEYWKGKKGDVFIHPLLRVKTSKDFSWRIKYFSA